MQPMNIRVPYLFNLHIHKAKPPQMNRDWRQSPTLDNDECEQQAIGLFGGLPKTLEEKDSSRYLELVWIEIFQSEVSSFVWKNSL